METSERVEKILEYIKALPASAETRVIAIDGRAASGKTTLAAALSERLGAAAVHMDDFFLPPELRTAERLAEPGGNVDYDRFAAEVLPRLHSPEPFSYVRFDCGTMSLAEPVNVGGTKWRVVEGSYSMHPRFGDYADVRAFTDVAPDEQRRRILARNGAEMLDSFVTRWIPMEEKYISAFGIRADILL